MTVGGSKQHVNQEDFNALNFHEIENRMVPLDRDGDSGGFGVQ
jgi:hypothetical protein